MQTFFAKLRMVFADAGLRNRIFFTLGILVLYRVLAAIPVPGANAEQLERYLAGNQFLGFFNIFSGGGFANLSIVLIGISPFITASIIFQLLTVMSPSLKESFEGESGRRKLAMYSRYLAVPLGAIQGFGFLTLLTRQGILDQLSPLGFATNLIVVIAGSILLMWLGELISEFGIGNGISMIIAAGIVAGWPQNVRALAVNFDPSQIPLLIGFVLLGVLVFAAVVAMTEAERPIPVSYAKRVRGMRMYGGLSTYLPLRLNLAGVMPIIFALSLLLIPQMATNFLINASNETVRSIATTASSFLANSIVYAVSYFLLVVVFTYFYTAIIFDPQQISENLQKGGAFVPGVRPGRSTSDHLGAIITRLTLVGALFLGVIAILPLVLQGATGQQALAIGGTSILIVVSVVLDTMKKLDAQLTMREY